MTRPLHLCWLLESSGGEDQLRADIELHQRFALPIACLVLPMVGIPLAISSQRSGKSVGVILSLVLVFIYYMILLAGFALALEGLLPVGPAVWMANLAFWLGRRFHAAAVGRSESPGYHGCCLRSVKAAV